MANDNVDGGMRRLSRRFESRDTHRDVQKFADGLVVAGAAIGHRQGVHAAPTQDGILVGAQGCHQRIGFLEAAVHRESDADREASQDFLMLRFLGVL